MPPPLTMTRIDVDPPLDLQVCGATKIAVEYLDVVFYYDDITLYLTAQDEEDNSYSISEFWEEGSPLPNFPYETSYDFSEFSGVDFTKIKSISLQAVYSNGFGEVLVSRIYLK